MSTIYHSYSKAPEVGGGAASKDLPGKLVRLQVFLVVGSASCTIRNVIKPNVVNANVAGVDDGARHGEEIFTFRSANLQEERNKRYRGFLCLY